MEMPSIDGYTVTRRELLRYGAGGAATLALGAMPSASLASLGGSACDAEEGRNVEVRAQRRADAAGPLALDHRSRRLHPRQDLRTALHRVGERKAHAVARAELHGEQGQQDVHLQAASRRQVLRRVAPDRRRRGLLPQSDAQGQEGRARLPRLRDQVARGEGDIDRSSPTSPSRGPRSSRTSQCSRTGSCRRTTAARARRSSSRIRSARARSR